MPTLGELLRAKLLGLPEPAITPRITVVRSKRENIWYGPAPKPALLPIKKAHYMVDGLIPFEAKRLDGHDWPNVYAVYACGIPVYVHDKRLKQWFGWFPRTMGIAMWRRCRYAQPSGEITWVDADTVRSIAWSGGYLEHVADKMR